jgi:hypothetical protein
MRAFIQWRMELLEVIPMTGNADADVTIVVLRETVRR